MIWTAEAVLTAIKNNHHIDCVREEDVVKESGLTATQVEQACLKLRKHGLLEKCEQGCHTITDAGREAMEQGVKLRSGPKKWTTPKVNKNSLRIRVWRAIRIRSKCSVPEIEMLVAQGNEKNITSNIGKYIWALEKAGFLTKLPKREPGTTLTSNGFIRYWLLPEMNTGPKAPVWRVAAKTVYDPNTEKEWPICG